MRTKAFRVFLQVVIWLAIYLLPYFVNYGKISVAIVLQEPGGGIHLISTILLVAYAYFNYYLLVPKFYLQRKYAAYIALIIASLLVVILLPQAGHFFGHQQHEFNGPATGEPPFDKLSLNGFRHNGPPSSSVSNLSYNVILFLISTFASISVRQQRQLLEAQKEKLDAELSFLKAQINPHFLFNTLNSIYALSIVKSDDTPKAIIQLSELMRYILKDSNSDTVPLDRELAYIGNYIALQKQRLGDTVQILYSAPTSVANKRVVPLILTSFVENAFKHGVNPNQDSHINISISLQDKQLHLLVVNNKITTNNQHETMGIGLKNATSRLEHLYPGKHQLTIDDGERTFSVNLILELND